MKKIAIIGLVIIGGIAASLYLLHLMAKSIAKEGMMVGKILPYLDLLIINIDRYIQMYLPFILIAFGLFVVILIKLYFIAANKK